MESESFPLNYQIVIQIKWVLKTLNNLSILLENNQVVEVKNLLNRLLPSYQSNSKIVDHIYEEQYNLKDDVQIEPIIKNQENKVIRIKTK